MNEAKKIGKMASKIQQHRETCKKRFAEVKKDRVLLEQQVKELHEKIEAYRMAEVQLSARYSALTDVMEGVEPVAEAAEVVEGVESAVPGPGATAPAPCLPHVDADDADADRR